MIDYNKKGIVFNIQKFSLNDGPGIRTVVFFKGCPLKCKWCANPESQNSKIEVLWDSEKCIKCLQCVKNCPKNAVSFENGLISINNSMCNGCLICVKNCPKNALKSEGEEKTIDEIVSSCIKDIDFYEESNGGVTLSGGEAMMHFEFATELLKALKSHNIHTAMETTGYTTPEIFSNVIQYIDLLLFDMKHWDNDAHILGTGVSNKLIIENLKFAISSGKKILIRIPVIPDFNNSLEDAFGFVKLLKELGITEVQLLPFHQYGEKKYKMLGKDYYYTDTPALHEEDLKEFADIFNNNNIRAFF